MSEDDVRQLFERWRRGDRQAAEELRAYLWQLLYWRVAQMVARKLNMRLDKSGAFSNQFHDALGYGFDAMLEETCLMISRGLVYFITSYDPVTGEVTKRVGELTGRDRLGERPQYVWKNLEDFHELTVRYWHWRTISRYRDDTGYMEEPSKKSPTPPPTTKGNAAQEASKSPSSKDKSGDTEGRSRFVPYEAPETQGMLGKRATGGTDANILVKGRLEEELYKLRELENNKLQQRTHGTRDTGQTSLQVCREVLGYYTQEIWNASPQRALGDLFHWEPGMVFTSAMDQQLIKILTTPLKELFRDLDLERIMLSGKVGRHFIFDWTWWRLTHPVSLKDLDKDKVRNTYVYAPIARLTQDLRPIIPWFYNWVDPRPNHPSDGGDAYAY